MENTVLTQLLFYDKSYSRTARSLSDREEHET